MLQARKKVAMYRPPKRRSPKCMYRKSSDLRYANMLRMTLLCRIVVPRYSRCLFPHAALTS